MRRKRSKRGRRESASQILQSAYSVDGQIGNSDHPPHYEQCRLFSPHSSESCTSSIFSSSANSASSFSFPSFLNRRQSQTEHFVDDFSVSMITEHTNRTQQQQGEQQPLSPPAYDSVMGSLVIRVTWKKTTTSVFIFFSTCLIYIFLLRRYQSCQLQK